MSETTTLTDSIFFVRSCMGLEVDEAYELFVGEDSGDS
jgi:hypothetical protein